MSKKGSVFASLFRRKEQPDLTEETTHEKQSENPVEQPGEDQTESHQRQASAEQQTPASGLSEAPSAVEDAAQAMAESAAPASSEQSSSQPVVEGQQKTATDSESAAPRKSWFQRLREGLRKTSGNLGSGISSLFRGKQIDDELFEDLETQLLMADVGMETTTRIIDNLTTHASRKELKDAELLYDKLKEDLTDILQPVCQPLNAEASAGPFVILMVGVNGVGKTTTIGKLAQQFQREGKSVMLAAGDTFRAAAVEQLQVWGERNAIPVVAQPTGSDAASVIYDGVQAAKARNVDVLIADTAGRLQNKSNLMEELKKIKRVMSKIDPALPHEVLLTLDAGTGQNAISQANLFNEAVGVTGLVMTKLDGTAKGGVIFALADRFRIPIRYIGVGEQLDDLRPFTAEHFVGALFEDEPS